MDNRFSIFQERFCYELIIIFYDFISKNEEIDNSILIENIKHYHQVFRGDIDLKDIKLNKNLKIPEEIMNNCLKKKEDENIKSFIIFYYVSAMAIMCISLKYINNIKKNFVSNPYYEKFENYSELLSSYNQYIKKEKNNIADFNSRYEIFKKNINQIRNIIKYFDNIQVVVTAERETTVLDVLDVGDINLKEKIVQEQLINLSELELRIEEEHAKRWAYHNMINTWDNVLLKSTTAFRDKLTFTKSVLSNLKPGPNWKNLSRNT